MFDVKSVVVGALSAIGALFLIAYLLLEVNAYIRNRKRFPWPKRAIIEKIRRYWMSTKNSFVIVDYINAKKFLHYTNWDDGYGKYNPSLGSLNSGDIILVPKRWGGFFVTVVEEVDNLNNMFRTNFLGVMHNDRRSISHNIKRFSKPKRRFWKSYREG